MHRELAFLFIVLICTTALSACEGSEASTVAATVTAQPSALPATSSPTTSPSPTLTETPSSTPTVTPTAGPSPTPAPTPVFGSARVGNDFLFGNQPEGCELPCWQGLVVGKSSVSDIQAMFDTAFGFDGSKVFEFKIWEGDTDVPPGLVNTYHLWTLREAENWNDEFLIELWIREDTRLLEAIRLDAEGNEFKPYSSPQQILRRLGVPSIMKTPVEQLADSRWGQLGISMMYSDMGITVEYSPIISIISNPQGNDAAKYCLSDLSLDGHYAVDVYVTAPFPATANELSPIQERYISSAAYSDEYLFQNVFDMSLEEATRLAQEKDNACIYAQLP